MKQKIENIPLYDEIGIQDFIEVAKLNPIFKLIGDSYEVLMDKIFEILDNPDWYYSFGFSKIIIGERLDEDLYLGDLLLLWIAEQWVDDKNIILSILNTEDKLVKIYYDLNDHQVKSSIEDCNGYGNIYTTSGLMAIVKRNNFQRDTGYDFTPIDAIPIEILIKKLKERKYGNKN